MHHSPLPFSPPLGTYVMRSEDSSESIRYDLLAELLREAANQIDQRNFEQVRQLLEVICKEFANIRQETQ